MSLVLVGLNHRTAPLATLERTTVDPRRLPKALHALVACDHVSEAVVLSTCNRTEVYAWAEKVHPALDDIRRVLAIVSGLEVADFADHLYTHHDTEAATHLFEVAAGLDSAVLGEAEILGQVRQAWDRAREEGAAGTHLNAVFRHALEVGKRARTDTDIGRHTTSVSQAAVAMAAERLGSLAGRKVLVLGAGDMGEGLAVSLAAWGGADISVANRTLSRAQALAGTVGGTAVPLGRLHRTLVDVDVLLTSTGATSLMVDHAELAPVVEARAGRPLLIVDVAVPRDVDPSVAELPGVTLLDMDDLRAFAARGLSERQREVARVHQIVEEEVVRFADEASARRVAPLLAALRHRAEVVRASEVERLAGRLGGLDERQREAVEALTKGIVNKLLHDPTLRLKDASGTPRGDRLADALRALFDL